MSIIYYVTNNFSFRETMNETFNKNNGFIVCYIDNIQSEKQTHSS